MKRLSLIFLLLLSLLSAERLKAQVDPVPAPQPQDPGEVIDSLRKLEEEGQDSVVYTAKFIRYTKRRFLNDSMYTLPLDTTLRGLQTYNPQYHPYSPSVHLGNFGLSTRDMLFTQRKNLGFDAGFHALDRFTFVQDSVNYFRARAPLTQLWYVNGSQSEQFFQLTHTQNIKPNWNVGAVYRRIGADGFFTAQRADHTNVMVWTWYQSLNGRYNLTFSGLYNDLKAGENGSTTDVNYFLNEKPTLVGSLKGTTRLDSVRGGRPAQTWRNREFSMKQYYNIGRIDSAGNDSARSILPTQRVSHEITWSTNRFKFFRGEREIDTARVFPAGVIPDTTRFTNDSTSYRRLTNEFRYSFYLRGRALSFIKNEMKLDVGLRHDLVWYRQMGNSSTIQNISVVGTAGYRFSDKIVLEADLEQVVQGQSFGDFLYEARTSLQLSRATGKLILGAYVLNRSPERMFERTNYQFHRWDFRLNNTKTSNLSVEYQNAALRFSAKAEYFLLNNYLYLQETGVRRQVEPTQLSNNINLLKVTVGNVLNYRKYTLENHLVYQKTDYQDILAIPEAYLFTSFYRSQTVFKSIYTQLGVDSRYNTPFNMPWYAVNISQFYTGQAANYETYPVIDIWLKASLRKATIFLKQSYINQNLFNNGYYTVNRYPMPDKLFVFGVRWNFYN